MAHRMFGAQRRLLSFVTRPELLDLVEQLIGEDTILSRKYHLRHSARSPSARQGDSLEIRLCAYYPIRPLATLVKLDRARRTPYRTSVPMRFVLGVPQRPQDPFALHWPKRIRISRSTGSATRRNSTRRRGAIMSSRAQMLRIIVSATCTLSTARRANSSGRRRAVLVERFMPGHCHYDHELRPPIGRARTRPATSAGGP